MKVVSANPEDAGQNAGEVRARLSEASRWKKQYRRFIVFFCSGLEAAMATWTKHGAVSPNRSSALLDVHRIDGQSHRAFGVPWLRVRHRIILTVGDMS